MLNKTHNYIDLQIITSTFDLQKCALYTKYNLYEYPGTLPGTFPDIVEIIGHDASSQFLILRVLGFLEE
jgi:hypothetical protein